MSEDHTYEQKWEFRRKGSDLDSSSEDKGSSSAKDPKLKKCNQLLSLDPAEDEEHEEEETSYKYERIPPKGAKNRQPNSVKNRQAKITKKNLRKTKGGTAKTNRGSKKTGCKYNQTSALHGLEMHVNVLVKELNTSREGFLKWMEDELEKLVQNCSSASPSKPAGKGKRNMTKKRGEPGKKAPNANTRSSKKVNANVTSEVVVEQKKAAQICVEEPQEAKEEAANPCKTVLALADNNKGKNSGMLSSEIANNAYVASNYLNLPNLNPRPLAENHLVKPNSSTLRIQPVVLNSQRDLLSAQQQSAAYYQGITLQSERDFDRSFSASMSGSMGSYGGFPSSSYNLGFKGGFNGYNLGGLVESESLAQENNFPSLRMMRLFSGSNGDINNNHLKY